METAAVQQPAPGSLSLFLVFEISFRVAYTTGTPALHDDLPSDAHTYHRDHNDLQDS